MRWGAVQELDFELVASSVFFTFCFDGGHKKERECEENRLLWSVVNKQDKFIATLEEALDLKKSCEEKER